MFISAFNWRAVSRLPLTVCYWPWSFMHIWKMLEVIWLKTLMWWWMVFRSVRDPEVWLTKVQMVCWVVRFRSESDQKCINTIANIYSSEVCVKITAVCTETMWKANVGGKCITDFRTELSIENYFSVVRKTLNAFSRLTFARYKSN